MKVFILLFCSFGTIVKWGSASKTNNNFCTEMNPQNSLDIEHIMGMWSGIEMILHRDPDNNETNPIDDCITIHLTEQENITAATTSHPIYQNNRDRNRNRTAYRHLKLLMDDNGIQSEYSLVFSNVKRGYWMSGISRKTTTSTTTAVPIVDFIGTVQVMKAVGNHLVLMFCEAYAPEKRHSIVLARQPMSLSSEEIVSVRNLLTRRGLQSNNTYPLCLIPNSSDTTKWTSSILILATLYISYLIL